MARRKTGRDIDGVVLLDKPVGLTSNAALQRVRRAFNARKAGHTGSLDPAACGLLPVCLGEATKLSAYLLTADKRYRVTATHGFETTTGDREGEPTQYANTPLPETDALEAALAAFIGRQRQIPPMYSALKHQGKRLYALARNGQHVERAPRAITVSALRLVERTAGAFTLDATVSAGTYIRTLVEDIAVSWGGRAHTTALRRIGVGDLGAARAMIPLATIETKAAGGDDLAALLWPVSALIADWPEAVLDAAAADDVRHGRPARTVLARRTTPSGHDGLLRLTGESGELFGLGTVDAAGRIVPKRLFARPQH
jgi:tRNA pseudouridine55 synthase